MIGQDRHEAESWGGVKALTAFPWRVVIQVLTLFPFLPWLSSPALGATSDVQVHYAAQTSSALTTEPPNDFSGVQSLPDEWTDDSTRVAGQRWYRISFDDPGARLPAVYLERICIGAEVWLNGVLIGGSGRMTEPISRNCYYPQLFRIPRNVLNAQDNHLDIRVVGLPLSQVSARQRAGGLSAVRIGSDPELRELYEQRYFSNITMAQIIGVSMILFGTLLLMLGWMRPQHRHYWYFGFTQILWAAIGVRLYWQDIPWPVPPTEILITSLFPPIVLVALEFLLRYLGEPRPWVTKLLAFQCLVVPAGLVAAPHDGLFSVASAVYSLLAGEFLVATVYFVWRSWHVMRADFWLIGGMQAVALILVAAEIAVQDNWLPLPKIHLIHFAMPLLLLGIGTRLVQQFASALADSEQANRELEQRVDEKTAVIERNYARLREFHAMEVASKERQRIAFDLHDDLGAKLLTISQVSLFANDIDRVATLARQALDDMRLSIRGLTGAPTPAPEVLADWRAETVERLTLAGVAARWSADEFPAGVQFPARTVVQMTRVLREVVSNVIRHSGASECWIVVRMTTDELLLGVDDNGRGFRPDRTNRGQGLSSIERRAHALEGRFEIGARENGGTSFRLHLPLPSAESGDTDRSKESE